VRGTVAGLARSIEGRRSATGDMDAKVVSGELRYVVRPLLKDLGFTKFTGRNAWRFTECATSVVNFQSFSAYVAEGVGCTTFSFGLNLGVYFDVVSGW
jgi:hypothetical protein